MSGETTAVVPVDASIGKRFLALVLDALILAIPCAIASHVIPFIGGFLVALLYSPVFESSKLQATIGKHLLGLQVTTLSGGRISFRAAVTRYFMKLVSSALCFLGYFVAFFTRRKQALHDLVAETVVVNGKSGVAVADAWMEQVRVVCRSQGWISGASPRGTVSRDSLATLERLQALRERGALTEEEFQSEKRKILGS